MFSDATILRCEKMGQGKTERGWVGGGEGVPKGGGWRKGDRKRGVGAGRGRDDSDGLFGKLL